MSERDDDWVDPERESLEAEEPACTHSDIVPFVTYSMCLQCGRRFYRRRAVEIDVSEGLL